MNKDTKLTMVSIYFNGKRHTFFLQARIENDHAVVAQKELDRLLDRLNVRRGDTYSIG